MNCCYNLLSVFFRLPLQQLQAPPYDATGQQYSVLLQWISCGANIFKFFLEIAFWNFSYGLRRLLRVPAGPAPND